MRYLLHLLWVCFGSVTLGLTAFAQAVDETDVLIDTPMQAAWVTANQQAHILYELHVTNLSKTGIELRSVEIYSDATLQKKLSNLAGEGVNKWMRRPGLSDEIPNKRWLEGGYRLVLFLNVSVQLSAVPQQLYHRLIFRTKDDKEFFAVSEPSSVRGRPPAIIAPPLRGAGWIAMNGLGSTSHHRRSYLSARGKAVVPQRFAIDWVRLGEDGKVFHDSRNDNKNYYGYGAEAFAVADAIVVDTRDGLPDTAPFAAGNFSLEAAPGNHVILKLDQGSYAFYGHLQPGSVRVKKGQRVRAGQVLGVVGSSGNSNLPHLHFHLMDRARPLLAEGLPYVFTTFTLQGNVGSIDSALEGNGIVKPPARQVDKRSSELPANLDVIRFPESYR